MIKRAVAVGTLALALTGPWQLAQAQATGSTDIDIDFPNIIILHFFSALSLDFTAGSIIDNEAVDQGAGTATDTLDDGSAFDANLVPVGGGASIPTSVDVTVANVWAVRGISSSGQMQVDIAFDTGMAAATNGGSVAAGSNLIATEDQGSTSGASVTFNAPGFAFANAVLGGIDFDLDISAVSTAANHTGMRYTISATAVP